MSRLRRVVVGYTFAPDGELALRSALALAERAHAALYLLQVVEPYPVYIKLRFPSVPAEALLGSVAEQVLRSTSCSVLTVRPNAFRFELP